HFSHPFLGTYEVYEFFDLGVPQWYPFLGGCNTGPFSAIFCGKVLLVFAKIFSYNWR
ncbi:hypothetical protein K443DRAFT_70856, partial [Laccaria amethystina LaAM-08-1]